MLDSAKIILDSATRAKFAESTLLGGLECVELRGILCLALTKRSKNFEQGFLDSTFLQKANSSLCFCEASDENRTLNPLRKRCETRVAFATRPHLQIPKKSP